MFRSIVFALVFSVAASAALAQAPAAVELKAGGLSFHTHASSHARIDNGATKSAL